MKIRNKYGQFTSEGIRGNNNPNWKGNSVGYFALHTWIYRTLGKPTKCLLCKSVNGIQWANISHKYKRKISDWISLCYVCHRRYDKITKFSQKTANTIKKRLFFGEKQVDLAKKYNVDPSTISNIFRGKIQFYG